MIGLLVASALLISACGKSEKAKTTSAPIPVTTATVRTLDVAHWADGIGSVMPLQDVELRTRITGVLAEVSFREGDCVKKGQLLARIDDREYKAALLQARAEKIRNQAQLRAAELDLERYNKLAPDGSISRRSVDQQIAVVDQLRATIGANDAAITAAEVQLSYTRIVSPLDGRVGLRRVDAGNLVQAGDARGLVTVTQIDPISVVFTLPQQQLPLIRDLLTPQGGSEPAVVSAFDHDGGPAIGTGKLTMIDNTVDAASGMIRLRAEFDNAGAKLWPGQFVTVRLRTGTSADALVTSARSVRQGLDGAYVFRIAGVGDQAKAEMVKVKTGFQSDEIVVITQGLAVGDRVVTDGYSRIKPGSRVRLLDPPKAADVAATSTPPAGHL